MAQVAPDRIDRIRPNRSPGQTEMTEHPIRVSVFGHLAGLGNESRGGGSPSLVNVARTPRLQSFIRTLASEIRNLQHAKPR